ncbi:ATP-binding protein [Sphingomonas sp. UYEF23]|uniref:ATP-binding protein n=1 Tax=Sphingomonas sp. UYEF23 TaxID=1756408 RepID=UPI00339900FC
MSRHRELFDSRSEHHDKILAVWERALAGEEFTVAEPLGDPALERRYYEMKFNVLRDANGQRIGAYMFAHDISDRLRDEQRLAETEEHLRQAQKIEAIGQLTGGVAHDFNNLLMVISGGLNLFERADLEKRERLMEGMRNAVERGAALRRQLLAFSRRKPLTPETVELPRQIDGMSELLDRTLRGDVHVETRFEDGLWPVRIDPAELELVLLNLRVNARDAMPDGGTITVTAANTNVVGSELTGDYVCLPVADTGVGMPPEVQAKVFEPFFTTKDVGKGSGLGMAQVYGFAKQSEGGVRVCSTVGK